MADLEIIDGLGRFESEALALFAQSLPKPMRSRLSNERGQAWRRALHENPFCDLTLASHLWLARRDNQWIGILLGVPFQGRAGTRILRGHWGIDLYVPQIHRGQGVGRALLTRWRDSSPLALGLGITDEAFAIERALGWTAVALPAGLQRPLSRRGVLFSLPGTRSSGHPGLRKTALHQVFGQRPRAVVAPQPPLTVKLAPLPPTGADALYTRIQDLLPAHVSRHEAFLNWRYRPPSAKHFSFLSLEQHDQLVALSVFRKETHVLGSKAWIFELLFDPRDTALGRRLVEETLLTLNATQTDLVACRMSAPHIRAILREEGFFRGRAGDRFIFHVAAPSTLAARLEDSDWYLTLGDSGNLQEAVRE